MQGRCGSPLRNPDRNGIDKATVRERANEKVLGKGEKNKKGKLWVQRVGGSEKRETARRALRLSDGSPPPFRHRWVGLKREEKGEKTKEKIVNVLEKTEER